MSFRQQLQGMEHTLTEEGKFSSAIAHAFNKLELVHFALNQTIVLGKREARHHSRFVSFNTQNRALEFADLAGSDVFKPDVELFSCTYT